MNFVFLMDPLEQVVINKDTSFFLMLGASRRGHKVYYLPQDGITLKDGRLIFDCVRVVPQEVAHEPFVDHTPCRLTQDEVDAVFIRSDPPFDEEYLFHTWLLERLPRQIPVINDPAGIRTVNEKVWNTQFSSLVPRTLITRKQKELLVFLEEEQSVIVKPTDSFGGASVFLVRKDDKNVHVILETMTDRWRKEVIMQQYVPESDHGDKRILLLNGEPLGAVLRRHAEDDHRNNFFSGGEPLPAEIDDRDREIIAVLKPELRRLGLYFVGVDIIGKYLIEVNVTSPTCLQEMARFAEEPLAEKVVAFAEELVAERRRESSEPAKS